MDRHFALAFGRMNPPTSGHLKVLEKTKQIADKNRGDHVVVLSHSNDPKKNPLKAEDKVKFAKKIAPGVNVKAATKELPTIMHHAQDAHNKGYTHLHVIAGSDRVKEYETLLNKYNGKEGHYNFKKITVHSSGERDPDAEGDTGISGTKMREHAKNKDIESFKKGLPSHISHDDAHEMMGAVRKGMALENRMVAFSDYLAEKTKV